MPQNEPSPLPNQQVATAPIDQTLTNNLQEGNDGKTGPGWSSPGPAGTASGQVSSGSLADNVKFYWQKLMGTSAFAPIVPSVEESQQTARDNIQSIVQDELNHANPVRAAIAKYLYGGSQLALETINKFIFGATTPENIGIGILTGGDSTTSQALKSAAGGYFAWRGSQALMEAKQPGETTNEEYQRRILGGVQAVAGAEGATEGFFGAKEAARAYAQKSLGLSGDLSAKVQAKIAQSEAIEKEIPVDLNQIKTEATQAIAVEQGKFEFEYAKLNAKATVPVTTVPDLKLEIINSIKSKGVQDAEIAKIENKIFAALPKTETTAVRAPTASEEQASRLAMSLSRRGMDIPSIRSALVNQGYVPMQVQTAMSMTFPDLEKTDENNVSYAMSRRVKTDLWDAAQSAGDVDMRRGLLDAVDNVDGIRQRYADAQGFGKQHSDLNMRYMKFMRELGSGTMFDFIRANDFNDQNTVLLQAKQLVNQDSAEGLRGLLRLAGVDTAPLKEALDSQKAFASQDSIVPGKSYAELDGKTNLQLRKEALEATANNAKKIGIANPFAFSQIMYGVAQLAFGSTFGLLHIGRGFAPAGVQRMLASESFQNFVARESGVTPEAMPEFREAISKSAPYLKKMAISTAVAASANSATQPKKQEPKAQPAPVQAPANQIQISQ